MSAKPKLRGGTGSELTKLKALWQDLSDDARAFWWEQFSGTATQAQLRAQIQTKLKINLRFDRQLTEFRQWAEIQEEEYQLASTIEERKTKLLKDGMTLEQAQEVLLLEASAHVRAKRDYKLGMRVSAQISDSRRLRVLEKKAAAFDAAKGLLENKELTEDQRAKRMREVFGISK